MLVSLVGLSDDVWKPSIRLQINFWYVPCKKQFVWPPCLKAKLLVVFHYGWDCWHEPFLHSRWLHHMSSQKGFLLKVQLLLFHKSQTHLWQIKNDRSIICKRHHVGSNLHKNEPIQLFSYFFCWLRGFLDLLFCLSCNYTLRTLTCN